VVRVSRGDLLDSFAKELAEVQLLANHRDPTAEAGAGEIEKVADHCLRLALLAIRVVSERSVFVFAPAPLPLPRALAPALARDWR
jgi:hypothetical protein